jgi:hypothetical protein
MEWMDEECHCYMTDWLHIEKDELKSMLATELNLAVV